VVYLISGFRWSFYESSNVNVVVSLAMTIVFFRLLGNRELDFPHRLSVEELRLYRPALAREYVMGKELDHPSTGTEARGYLGASASKRKR
jgi:hypothetical protein